MLCRSMGLNRHPRDLRSGAYRFAKHLYFIVPRASSAAAERFTEIPAVAAGSENAA